MPNYKNGLLFSQSDAEFSSGYDTPYDLRLDTLLPKETVDFFRIRPTKEEFLARREFFTVLLSAPETYSEHFTRLREKLVYASESYDGLSSAVCENARNYIFAEFAARMAEFYSLAAEPRELGALYASFNERFRTKCASPEFSELTKRLGSISVAKATIGAPELNTEGDHIKVSRDPACSMRSKVAACLEKYGIDAECKQQKPLPVEKSIIDALSKLYPAEFAEFSEFYREFNGFFDNGEFECIPQFSLILGIIDLVSRAKAADIPYCFPKLNEKHEVRLYDVYDIALLLKDGTKIVPNDVSFTPEEPFFYLTGANGGGKTTYLRALGNAMLLFPLGAPVFCRDGEACLLDSVQTHFPKDERFDGSGRFADEQKRVDTMLSACENSEGRGNSLILLNETYSTTNEDKATKCTVELAERLHASGNFGLYITHQHGVDDGSVPFLGVVIDEQDSNRRTYRIEKRRLKNRSFASDILAKYGITEEGLKRIILNKH